VKGITIILLHLGYWLCYGLLVFFLYALPLRKEPLPATVVEGLRITFTGAMLPAVTGFYLFYFQLVPRLLAKRNIKLFIKRGILVSMLTGLIFSLWATAVLHDWKPGYPVAQYKVMQETAPWLFFWMFLGFSFIIGMNGIVSTLLRGFVSWYLNIRVKENLERETMKAQLELLRAQLHPHFLFNTLNNIDALIMENPQVASQYLVQLSGVLRFMLYQSADESVLLARELEFVSRYLELQKIRTNNKRYVEFVITGTDPGHSIAPLLYLPFLENAFKHATNKRISKAVAITFHIGEKDILFSCRNVIDNHRLETDTPGGLGLKLVRKRLELLYKDKYELTIQHTETVFYVQLRINY
jgi:hypothetical protein